MHIYIYMYTYRVEFMMVMRYIEWPQRKEGIKRGAQATCTAPNLKCILKMMGIKLYNNYARIIVLLYQVSFKKYFFSNYERNS